MTIDDIAVVYVTVRDHTEGERIGRALVEERLATCVNILPAMRSIYRWQGAIEHADEAVLIIKTRAALYARVEARVRALHSYALPCVLELPVARGCEPYLAWLRAGCSDERPG